ncbi:twin-arginine translocase subunit TatB [Acidiphilium iwatense]|uniref:Twin-arginine translocase subunit TatB n=1 Tax=Acidiphilium iwatense TaxID=768198 RepID=A0ABS9E0H1_9PROT|nr:twin-arginine translocase subunit TatB [Acidiphilium iwatense]
MILVVALVVIGPKDLPVAIRTASAALRKMRGLASEFQGHVQELLREADLADVGAELRNLRNFDLGSVMDRHIDPDGELRHAFDPASGDPQDMAVPEIGADAAETRDEEPVINAPAFIPPDAARHHPMPAFIPPGTRLW